MTNNIIAISGILLVSIIILGILVFLLIRAMKERQDYEKGELPELDDEFLGHIDDSLPDLVEEESRSVFSFEESSVQDLSTADLVERFSGDGDDVYTGEGDDPSAKVKSASRKERRKARNQKSGKKK